MNRTRIYNRAISPEKIRPMYIEHALMGDFQSDGTVDLNDFAVLADAWQTSDSCEADLTCDCIVNFEDLIFLVDEWLNQI